MEEFVNPCRIGFVEFVETALMGFPMYHIRDCVVPVFALCQVLPEVCAEVCCPDGFCLVAGDGLPVDV